MPKVSIIIPLYNKEKYIANTIESIFRQTYNDFELIIVDDGSTDRSGEIARSYQDNRISVFQVTNGGVSSARNVGLSKASGEWIWFVDADDVPDENWLKKVAVYLEDSSIDIIMGDFKRHLPDDKEEKITIIAMGRIQEKTLAQSILDEQMSTGYYGYLWNKLIRKSFIDIANARFKVGLTLAEDLKFMTEMYQHNPRCFIFHENAMTYYVDTVNSSNEKEIDYPEQLKVWWNLLSYIEENGIHSGILDKKKQIVNSYVASVFFYEFEKNHSIKGSILWLQEHFNYIPYLDVSQVNGVHKKIISFVKCEQFARLRLYLKMRHLGRSLYRRIRI